jgi:hypothetical protein
MNIRFKYLDGTPILKIVIIDVQGQAATSHSAAEQEDAVLNLCHTFTLVRNFGKYYPDLPVTPRILILIKV